jgi:hypothetical protein
MEVMVRNANLPLNTEWRRGCRAWPKFRESGRKKEVELGWLENVVVRKI